MQPSLRVLIPFAFFAYAQASLVQPRSAPSAIPVPILDNSAAIAQAKPGRTAATKAIPGGAVTNAGLQPHNLTGNAAQTDALLYLCQEQNCGGTCEYFDLNTLSPNTCYYPQPVFPYLSAHIEDGGVALPYAVSSLRRAAHYQH
jgi:hypothetical protein